VTICHVAPELLPVPPTRGGAIERWIRDATHRLILRGHEVHVISRDHGDDVREACLDGVHYHYIRIPKAIDRGRGASFFRGLWYFVAAARLLARVDPDVVHHHNRAAGLYIGRMFARRSRQVISLHSMSYGWHFIYRAWDSLTYRRAFQASDRVLCVSNFVTRHFLELYPDMASKTRTLYNGVDGGIFHPDSKSVDSKTEHDSGDRTVLFVGRVEERKGVHVLLDAFERVVSSTRNVKLRLVGPHSYWNVEPSTFYRLLADRCRTIPHVELQEPTYVDRDLAEIYRTATISVVPSVFPEALGLTSLEAQASGVPVVVSNAGGLPETVLPNESGVVFENGDVEGLAASLLSLLNDPERVRSMGVAARDWAMKHFSWDVIATQLESIYEEL
jgi:spore coat protein SA